MSDICHSFGSEPRRAERAQARMGFGEPPRLMGIRARVKAYIIHLLRSQSYINDKYIHNA